MQYARCQLPDWQSLSAGLAVCACQVHAVLNLRCCDFTWVRCGVLSRGACRDQRTYTAGSRQERGGVRGPCAAAGCRRQSVHLHPHYRSYLPPRAMCVIYHEVHWCIGGVQEGLVLPNHAALLAACLNGTGGISSEFVFTNYSTDLHCC